MRLRNSLFIALVFANTVLSSGFPAQTLVKCGDTYVPIEQLNVGDIVECYSVEHGNYVEQPITHKTVLTASSYICIITNNEAIVTSYDQKFYLPDAQHWQQARSLRIGDVLLGQENTRVVIEDIIAIEEPIGLFDLTVKDNHNFLVSHNRILVHNIIPLALGLSWAFGSGAIQFSGASAALGGLVLLKMHSGKNKSSQFSVPGFTTSGSSSPEDPDKDKNKKKNKKNEKRPRKDQKPLTNKEAREQAEKMGYKEVKNVPFNNHGGLTFKKDKNFISVDKDCHRGGVWKLFDRRNSRQGTWNIDLTKKLGE